MDKIIIEEFKLIGIALLEKTTNENGQSYIDCGNLWGKFQSGNYASKIPNKLDDEVIAVYHQYEGDHTQPYSFFIGCKVQSEMEVPDSMETIKILKGNYQKIIAKGKFPDCIVNTWKEIWDSNISRTYQTDFEVYGEKSKDWNDAEVEIYISVD